MRMALPKPGSVKPVGPRPKGTMGDDVGGYNRPGAPKPSKPRKPGGPKPPKGQKPVLFGMAKGGAVKRGKK